MSKSVEKEDSKEKAPAKKPKLRSPNYPRVSLGRALQLASKQHQADRLQAIPAGIAHTRWGYSSGTGRARLREAALKAFGLIDTQGTGAKRTIKITDDADKIIRGHSDRDEILKRLALKPSIHRDVWKKYDGELPQNDVLRQYLIWEKGFNEQAVDRFISQLRETISFAKLTKSDILGAEEPEDEEEEQIDPEDKTPPPSANPLPKKDPPKMEQGQFEDIRFALPSGKAVLYLPANMRPEEFDILQTIIDAHKRVRQALAGKVKDEPEDDGQSSSS